MKKKLIKILKTNVKTIISFNLLVMLQQGYPSINTKFYRIVQKQKQQKVIHFLQHDLHDFLEVFGLDALSPESIS